MPSTFLFRPSLHNKGSGYCRQDIHKRTDRRNLFIGESFERGDGYSSCNLVVGFLREVDYALVGAAAEVELGVAEGFDEGAVDEGVDIWQDHAHALVGEDLLICEAGVAPDVLAGLLLYAAGQLGEGLDLVERVAAGECDIRELVGLDDLEQFIDRHFPAAGEIPRLRVVTARAMMGAARTIDRCAESRPVSHCLFEYIQNPYFIVAHKCLIL